VLLFLGVVQQRRKPRRELSASPVVNGISHENEPAHEPAAVTFTAPTVVAEQVLESDEVKPVEVKPIGERPQVAIATNGSSKHRPSRRRRKIFDYHRFYVDTVMKLSSSGYTAEVSTPNEHAHVHSNGHTNGHSNGHGNGHSNGAANEGQPPSYVAMNQAIAQAHMDLIANQKELIEEQKHLLTQQAKLIDEKSKLIAEKTQLLDRQTELFERDIL
jgi:hypothetical protein